MHFFETILGPFDLCSLLINIFRYNKEEMLPVLEIFGHRIYGIWVSKSGGLLPVFLKQLFWAIPSLQPVVLRSGGNSAHFSQDFLAPLHLRHCVSKTGGNAARFKLSVKIQATHAPLEKIGHSIYAIFVRKFWGHLIYAIFVRKFWGRSIYASF